MFSRTKTQTPSITMTAKDNPYMIEVGHSKSGSNHVMIIKSLRVEGDDLTKVFQDLQSALKAYDLITKQSAIEA